MCLAFYVDAILSSEGLKDFGKPGSVTFFHLITIYMYIYLNSVSISGCTKYCFPSTEIAHNSVECPDHLSDLWKDTEQNNLGTDTATDKDRTSLCAAGKKRSPGVSKQVMYLNCTLDHFGNFAMSPICNT